MRARPFFPSLRRISDLAWFEFTLRAVYRECLWEPRELLVCAMGIPAGEKASQALSAEFSLWLTRLAPNQQASRAINRAILSPRAHSLRVSSRCERNTVYSCVENCVCQRERNSRRISAHRNFANDITRALYNFSWCVRREIVFLQQIVFAANSITPGNARQWTNFVIFHSVLHAIEIDARAPWNEIDAFPPDSFFTKQHSCPSIFSSSFEGPKNWKKWYEHCFCVYGVHGLIKWNY